MPVLLLLALYVVYYWFSLSVNFERKQPCYYLLIYVFVNVFSVYLQTILIIECDYPPPRGRGGAKYVVMSISVFLLSAHISRNP